MSFFDSIENAISSTSVLSYTRTIPLTNSFELTSDRFDFEKLVKLSPTKNDVLLIQKNGDFLRIINDSETKMITFLSNKPIVIE